MTIVDFACIIGVSATLLTLFSAVRLFGKIERLELEFHYWVEEVKEVRRKIKKEKEK